MSAKDIYHDACVHALQKDGWTITAVFKEAKGQMLLRHTHLRLIVFDPVMEVIIRWIN